MATNVTSIRPEVEDEIRRIVAEIMVDFPVQDCTVEAKPDHDGDEAIFVDIHHDLVGRPYNPLLETDLLRKLSDKLYALGERRYLYIAHHLPDRQKVMGW